MTPFLAALIKELRLLSRDWHAVGVLFLMPAAFVLIMSLALQGQDDGALTPRARVAVAHHQEGPDQDLLHRLLSDVTSLELTRGAGGDSDRLERRLVAGELDAVLFTTEAFEEDLLPEDDDERTDRPSLVLTARADVDSATLMLLRNAVKEAYAKVRLNQLLYDIEEREFTGFTEEEVADLDDYVAPDALRTRIVDVRGAETRKPSAVQQSVPAWLIFGMFFIVIPLSHVMVAEQQSGALTRLRSIGVSATSLLTSKLVPYFLINQIQFLLMLAIGVLLVPLFGGSALVLQGQPAAYVLLSLAVSLAALGYGVLISVVVRTADQATIVGGGINILLAAVGGIMVPKYVMPDSMQALTNISPMAWGLSGFHDLLLGDAGVRSVMPEALLLGAMGVTLLLLAIWRLNRDIGGRG